MAAPEHLSPDDAESHVPLSATQLPVEARGLAIGILASLATVFALSWAQAFLVPLLLGIVIAYTLNPLVAWLERGRIPRAVGTAVVMAGVIATVALCTYSLRSQMQTIIEQLPEAASKSSTALARVRSSQNNTLQKIQSAATEVETAAAHATGRALAPRQPATHVIVDLPKFRLSDQLWAGSIGAIGAAGQAAMVVFLAFFLLLEGEIFKRKLMRVTGPSLSKSWGMLLSIPIIVIVKVVSQHIEELHPLAELLGE